MGRSRIQSTLQSKTKNNILLALVGLVFFILVILFLGPKLIIGLSLLVGKDSKESISTSETQSNQYIEPPTLNETFTATNSASIDLQGKGNPHFKIILFRNGSRLLSTTSHSDGSFEFSGVLLKDGINELKTKQVSDSEVFSEYSNVISINRSNKNPSLDIKSPSDNQRFKGEESPIKVTGKTESGNKVTVNDFWAIVDDQGNFTYQYALHDGENPLNIKVSDPAGNITQKQITIHKE